MTSDDFANIFYSNYSPNVDWANIGEINWMYQEGLFTISSKIIGSSKEFLERIDLCLDPKNGLTSIWRNTLPCLTLKNVNSSLSEFR